MTPQVVDYLTPNEGEAERLCDVRVDGVAAAAKAAHALLGRGVGHVIATLGEQGALACSPDGDLHVLAFPVTVVDTTAAGDAFNGALAVALAERATLSDALKFASAAAALTCTKRGARPSLPSRADVRRLL